MDLGPTTCVEVLYFLFLLETNDYLRSNHMKSNYNKNNMLIPRSVREAPLAKPRLAKQDTHCFVGGRHWRLVGAAYTQRSNLRGVRFQIPFRCPLCQSLVSCVAEWSCLLGCGYLRKVEKSVKGKWCTKVKNFRNLIGSFIFQSHRYYYISSLLLYPIIKIQTV